MGFSFNRLPIPESKQPRRLPDTAEGAGREAEIRIAETIGDTVADVGASIGAGLAERQQRQQKEINDQQLASSSVALQEAEADLLDAVDDLPLTVFESPDGLDKTFDRILEERNQSEDGGAEALGDLDLRGKFQKRASLMRQQFEGTLRRKLLDRQKVFQEEAQEVLESRLGAEIQSFDGADEAFALALESNPNMSPKDREVLRNNYNVRAASALIVEDAKAFRDKLDAGDYDKWIDTTAGRQIVRAEATERIKINTTESVDAAIAATQLRPEDFQDLLGANARALVKIYEAQDLLEEPEIQKDMGARWIATNQSALAQAEASYDAFTSSAMEVQQALRDQTPVHAPQLVIDQVIANDPERMRRIHSDDIAGTEQMMHDDINVLNGRMPAPYQQVFDQWWESKDPVLADKAARIGAATRARQQSDIQHELITNPFASRKSNRTTRAMRDSAGERRILEQEEYLARGGGPVALEAVIKSSEALLKEGQRTRNADDVAKLQRFRKELQEQVDAGDLTEDDMAEKTRLFLNYQGVRPNAPYEALKTTTDSEFEANNEPQARGFDGRKPNQPHTFIKDRSEEDTWDDLLYLVKVSGGKIQDMDNFHVDHVGADDRGQVWSVSEGVGGGVATPIKAAPIKGDRGSITIRESDFQLELLPSKVRQRISRNNTRISDVQARMVSARGESLERLKTQLQSLENERRTLSKVYDGMQQFRTPDTFESLTGLHAFDFEQTEMWFQGLKHRFTKENLKKQFDQFERELVGGVAPAIRESVGRVVEQGPSGVLDDFGKFLKNEARFFGSRMGHLEATGDRIGANFERWVMPILGPLAELGGDVGDAVGQGAANAMSDLFEGPTVRRRAKRTPESERRAMTDFLLKERPDILRNMFTPIPDVDIDPETGLPQWLLDRMKADAPGG